MVVGFRFGDSSSDDDGDDDDVVAGGRCANFDGLFKCVSALRLRFTCFDESGD